VIRWLTVFVCTLAISVLSLAALLAPSPVTARQGSVAVIYPKTEEAAYRRIFESVLEGIRQRLGRDRLEVYPLQGAGSGQLKDALAYRSVVAVITLGRQAYQDYQASGVTVPVVSGLLDLSPDLNPGANGISLSVDPPLLLEILKRVLPDTKRIHVVYNPAKDQWLIDLAKQAAPKFGVELIAYEASNLNAATQRYLDLIQHLEAGRDALWLPLDNQLLEEDTVLPLIIESSWHRRFAVFSNSLPHARLGALFALYPDNEALGRHLAERAIKLMNDPRQSHATITPLRDVKRAIHRRFAEHLGIDLGGPLRAYFDTVFGADAN